MTPRNTGTTSQSIKSLQELLRKEPSSPRFVELANLLQDAGRVEEAIEVCQQGLRFHPDSAPGIRAQGRALMLAGRLQEAQTVLLGLLKTSRDDARAMLLITDVLLQKADPGRARAMLRHASKLLPGDDPEVARLWAALGGMTGEIDVRPPGARAGGSGATLAKALSTPAMVAGTPGHGLAPEPSPGDGTREAGQSPPRRAHPGPLIGGRGAIINVEEVDEGLDLGPVELDPAAGKPSAGAAGRVVLITLLLLLAVGSALTVWRMRGRAGVTADAVKLSRDAMRTGSLERYRAARSAVRAALATDPNSPDLHAWLAKIEARMALEYMIDIKRVPAAIFGAEKILRKLQRHPPGPLRRLQVRLGLAYRTASWGAEAALEAQAIQRLLMGVRPAPGARRIRAETVRMLSKGMARYPQALGLRYLRGLAHLAEGDFSAAARDLEETVKRDKDHVPAQLAMAQVLLEQGRVVEAQERFNRVLGVNPRSLRARLGLIQARLMRQRELDRVSAELRKLTPGEKTPRLIRAWHSLASAWLLWAQGKLGPSAAALGRASRQLIPEARWLAWYIRLCLLLGEVDSSRRPLKHGLAVLRGEGDPLIRALGLEVELNRGLPGPVIAGARKLLVRLGPKSPVARQARLVLARAFIVARRYSEALKVLAALARLKPEPADAMAVRIYSHLARGLRAQEQLRRADARAHGSPRPGGRNKKGRSGADTSRAAEATRELAAARGALVKLTAGRAAPLARYALARLTPDAAQAMELLAKGVAHHRDAALAGVLYARLLINAGRLADARQQVEQAMERAPAYYPALRARARIRMKTGYLVEALDDSTTLCYAGHRARMPRSILRRLAHTARWAARLSSLDRTTLCPSAMVRGEDLILRASILIAQERPESLDSALILLAMAGRMGASSPRLAVLEGLALLSGQQTPERGKQVESLLKAQVKKHPDLERSPLLHFAMGKALHSMNRLKGAIRSYTLALKLSPAHLPTLRSLGWLLLGAGKSVEAAARFREALAVAKRWDASPARIRARLQFALGMALLAKGKGDLKGAGAAFTEALSLNGRLYQAAVALAKVHLASGKLARAKSQLEDVLRAAPDNPDALLLMAQIMGRAARTRDRSRKLVTRLLKHCAREILAGRPEEGRYWLEQVLAKMRRPQPLARLMLGSLLARYPAEARRSAALLRQARAVKPPAWLGPLLAKLRGR